MTHAKAILFGEHSVVYGKLGISIPLKEMTIDVEIDDNLGTTDDVIKNIFKLCNVSTNKKCIINSNIPIGKGLGSSAALAVEICNKLNISNTYEIATQSEEYVHGKSSGIDLNQVMRNLPLKFIKNKSIEEFNFNLDTKLLIVDTNVIGSTKEAVELVRKNYDINYKYIEELGNISNQALNLLENKKLLQIGELMYIAHYYLNKIGVSDISNNIIVNIAKRNNALGAKLTGAGMGGCCIVLCENEKFALSMKKIYKQEGYNSWIISI